MLDPKVAEEARQAWDKFMQQVNRMECRMLTAMADQIDKQWAEMVAPVSVPENEPFCWAAGVKENFFFACHRTKRDADDAAVEAAMGIGCQEWDVWPLYAAPVAVFDEPRTPFFPSEFAALQAVAIAQEQRHVDQSCCAERQEPDVGEGWRWVKPGEILRDGDEFLPYWSRDDENPWREINCTGMSVGANEPRTYRRRVEPDEQPIEITPAAVSAMRERNARDALLKKIELLKEENHEQQEKILQACLENERLRSEVERFVPEAPQSRPAETRASRSAWATPEEELAWFKKRVKWLDGEVERLRLTGREVRAIRAALYNTGVQDNDVVAIESILKRLGGDS